MSLSRVRILLIVFVLIATGSGVFVHIQVRYERRQAFADMLDTGYRLINLISLYPVSTFAPEQRSIFLKTLSEQLASRHILYLFIHDQKGDTCH